MTVDFCTQLTDWYSMHKRDLPWRKTRDPYRIWISETILQQTRVAQGLPYYERFLERFPSVRELALKKESEVLKLWQGLDYYSRARNLHKAAIIIHEKYHDRFPADYSLIRDLPGIGDYTAAAIASFAYSLCHPVMDGNVIRVMCRLHGIFELASSQSCRKRIMELLQKHIDPEHASEFNQAIMEFGALACTPTTPVCQRTGPDKQGSPRIPQQSVLFQQEPLPPFSGCPFQQECYAFCHGITDQLPIKKTKNALPVYELHYLLINDSDSLWVHKRGYNDLWRGMFDLPSLPKRYRKESGHDKPVAAENGIGLEFLKHYEQVLSHRRLNIFFYRSEAGSQVSKEALEEQEDCLKVKRDDLCKLAVPKNIEKFFKDFRLTENEKTA